MPRIACLCGSTRFKDSFLEENRELTLQNYIVLMPGVFAHNGDSVTDAEKKRLDVLHKKKIAMSDFVMVIDVDGYIGESTKSEIEFAISIGVPVYYMSEMKDRRIWSI